MKRARRWASPAQNFSSRWRAERPAISSPPKTRKAAAVSIAGRARSLTFAPFLARKSATAWIRSWTSVSTSKLASSRITATLRSPTAACAAVATRGATPRRHRERSGDQRQRQLEVVGTARQRSGDGEVGLFPDARHDMAHPVGDAIGRLVAVDATIVRDVAHAAAEIDAELQPGQAGGQRRSRAARGAARRARPRSQGLLVVP